MAVYLVTGGAGFIGSNLVKVLLEREKRVRVLDDFSTGKRENLDFIERSYEDRIEIMEGNICDIETCREACDGVDYVLHHAAMGSVFRSIDSPVETHNVNVTGTLHLLVSSREAGVKRFIFASSSSIYGDQTSSPDEVVAKREAMKADPQSPYAVSKISSEYYVQVFYRLYGLQTVILRYFNVFGERQDPDSIYSAVIPKFIKSLLSGQVPTIYGDGEQSRDFTYVGNVVRANINACQASTPLAGEVINIACGNSVSVNQLYGTLAEILGRSYPAHYANPRPGEVRHSLADITKAQRLLDFKPEKDIQEGLLKTLNWFKVRSM